MGNVSQNLVAYGASSIISKLAPVALLPIMARALTAEEVGSVALALAIAQVIVILFTLGINISITRTYYDEPERSGATTWAGLLVVQMAFATALALLMLIACRTELMRGVLGDFAGPLSAATAIGWAMSLQQGITGVARAARRANDVLISTLLQSTVTFGVAMLGLVSNSVDLFLLAMAFGPLGATLYLVIRIRPRPKYGVSALTSACVLGAPFIVHSLALWGLSLSDRVLIQAFLGSEQVGRYYLLYSIATVPLLVFDAVNSVVVPRLMAVDYEQAVKRAIYVSRLWFLAAAVMVIGVNALAWPAMLVLNLPPDPENRLIIAIISLVALTRPGYFLLVALRLHGRRISAVATASLVAVVVNIVLNVLLLDAFGLLVAAGSTLAAYAVQLVMVQRRSGLGSDLRDRTMLAGALIVVAASVLTVALPPIGLCVSAVSIAGLLAMAATTGEAHKLRAILRSN